MKTEKNTEKDNFEYKDSLSAARGCFNGLVIGMLFWVIIFGVGYLVIYIAK